MFTADCNHGSRHVAIKCWHVVPFGTGNQWLKMCVRELGTALVEYIKIDFARGYAMMWAAMLKCHQFVWSLVVSSMGIVSPHVAGKETSMYKWEMEYFEQ